MNIMGEFIVIAEGMRTHCRRRVRTTVLLFEPATTVEHRWALEATTVVSELITRTCIALACIPSIVRATLLTVPIAS